MPTPKEGYANLGRLRKRLILLAGEIGRFPTEFEDVGFGTDAFEDAREELEKIDATLAQVHNELLWSRHADRAGENEHD